MDYWQQCAVYRQHALDCGVNMTNRCAVPVDGQAIGCIAAVDILHPETLEMMHPSGFAIRANDVNYWQSQGLDYFIVEASYGIPTRSRTAQPV